MSDDQDIFSKAYSGTIATSTYNGNDPTTTGVGIATPPANTLPYSTSTEPLVGNSNIVPLTSSTIQSPKNVVKTFRSITLIYGADSGGFSAIVSHPTSGFIVYETDVSGTNVDFPAAKLNLLTGLSDFISSPNTALLIANGDISSDDLISLAEVIADVTINFISDTLVFQNYFNQLNATNQVVDVAFGSSSDPLAAISSFLSGAASEVSGILGSAVSDLLGGSSGSSNTSPPTYSDLILGMEMPNTSIVSCTTFPKINTVLSLDTGGANAFITPIPLAKNPVNPNQPTVANPETRVSNPIAGEPQKERKSEYPYNKAHNTEGGHLIEVDDTPGSERLLTQHKSGTYQEMHQDGSLVHKVVGDNYTIVAHDNIVIIQGKCSVRILGDATLKVGGHLVIDADAGINMISKGDFRVKARSICMDAEAGDFSMNSAGNIDMMAKGDFNNKATNINQESSAVTSNKTGSTFVVNSDDFSVVASGDINMSSAGDFNETAGGNLNLLPTGYTAIGGSSIEMGSTANFNNQTNLTGVDPQGGNVTPITGTGSQTPTAATKYDANPAAEAKGSGIAYSTNPDKLLEDADDDPQAAAAAIKHGLENGMISKDELNATPTVGGTDSGAPGNTKASFTNPTIGNLGSSAPENMKLSNHFMLSRLSSACPSSEHPVMAQCGLSVTQIVGNLQLLAQNCLEPIITQYPDLVVTCGFRPNGLNVPGGSSKSQHHLGQAADMQFKSAQGNVQRIYNIAQWIKANVVFDQLLLEYKSTGSKLPWIHISFNGAKNGHQVLTLMNGSTHSKGLALLT